MKNAIIALEDGVCYNGKSFGAEGVAIGEIVFNTSLTGYQEILTDPSYSGQIVTMTYPLIGNYGINDEDSESAKPWVEGFIVRENSHIASNFRKAGTLTDYLRKNKIVAIEGIDTRALTRHIRLQGAMKGIISTLDFDVKSLVAKMKAAPSMEGQDIVKRVTTDKTYVWADPKKAEFKVVVYDCGVKHNILRNLEKINAKVIVVPATTPSAEVLKMDPDGILLSNGPGDPAAVTYMVENAKALIGKKPIFGICLGNQILGLALGGKTYKLKFGHHGGNQPVMNLKTRKVEITAQNHGFAVDMESLPKGDIELTHINLNDKTSEGMRHRKLPIFSVQYHPEAGPGPHDANYLFDQFAEMMRKGK